MIKAATFDLDGTLLNRDESVKLFIDEQYDRLHKFIPEDKYRGRTTFLVRIIKQTMENNITSSVLDIQKFTSFG
jgi:FMN phosphatase YigB (HAD superfamily)